MRFNINITNTKTVNQIDGYWSDKDYSEILKMLEYEDAANASGSELLEYLNLALTELEPHEAAAVVLEQQLGDQLNKNQIDQISHDMPKENQAQHYSGIPLQRNMFHINNLLYRAFNGTFPRAEATITTLSIKPVHDYKMKVDEAFVLRALNDGISDRATIKRIFKEQMAGEEAFDEAPHLIWYLEHAGDHQYKITTSTYWLDRSDLAQTEYITTIEQ